MQTLILGEGQVGSALYEVLVDHYPIRIYDVNPPKLNGIEIMHICFPWKQNFGSEVIKYRRKYQPMYTVIHSTVPVGTSACCGATHSPIRGNHSGSLVTALKTFVKFVGGKDADVVAKYFYDAGLRVYICRESETTELAKLLCSTFYGLCIEFTKAAERECNAWSVPFAEAWTLWQETYNEGYLQLGHPEYQRPVLTPMQMKIGGHCVIPNCELLDMEFARLLRVLENDYENRRRQ